MKMLVLLSLSLAVVMAMPPLEPGVEEEKSAPELPAMEQSQNMVLKDKAEVEAGDKAQSEVKVESDLKPEGEGKVEPELKVNAKSETETEPGLVDNPDLKVEPELKVNAKSETETEPELVDNPDLKVESEVKVEPDVLENMEHKEEPEFSELEGGLAKVNLKAPETDQELHEEQGDMEKKVLDDPAADQEQEDDDSMLEEEPGKVEEVSEMRARAYEPEGESIEKNQEVPESYVPENEEEGPALDSMGEKMRSLEEYFPNEEARVDYSLVKGLKSDFGPVEEKKAVAAMANEGVEGAEAAEQGTVATKHSYCPGVILYGKCYQFFREPRRAESAEFFCQDHFPGGHLASVTNAFVHRELMNLILRRYGRYRRTWIGGLRYLQTNRFIWLDGSQWKYEDWLPGEPSRTSSLENCVELLPYRNGKFNDFTCWEPQAFICSYPYH